MSGSLGVALGLFSALIRPARLLLTGSHHLPLSPLFSLARSARQEEGEDATLPHAEQGRICPVEHELIRPVLTQLHWLSARSAALRDFSVACCSPVE